jgi:hypothetical protein
MAALPVDAVAAALFSVAVAHEVQAPVPVSDLNLFLAHAAQDAPLR